MNERIKELSLQASDSIPDDVSAEHAMYLFQKKFAELIVRECMKVAVNKDSGYMHPANVAGHIAAGRSTAAQMIKEHFGVE
jgi:hypothetical protein